MKQPNIVYIFADQWRRQAAGFMNEDDVLTPRIDQFASESVVCEQAVSCTPLCSPHRAALMTGKYALPTGVYTNCKVGLDIMLRPDETCVGDVLKAGGYATGYIGKWHLDLPEQNIEPFPKSGARDWDAFTPPGPKRHGFDYWYSYGTFDDHLSPHYWMDSAQQIQVNEWSVQHETEMALRFIEEKKDDEQPFSLFLSWNPPHSPFELVPEKYKQLYKERIVQPRANVTIQDPFLVHTGETIPGGAERWEQSVKDYFAAISGIDEQFGKIIDALEQWGLTDNTIVVLTSDHGELLGSHGMFAKHSWHEESIGVPLLIRWPEQLKPKVCDDVINTVDIMPTLLELAGLDTPHTVQGNSAADLLKTVEGSGSNQAGERAEEQRLRRLAFLSAVPGRIVAIEQFAAAGLNNLAFGWRAVRSKQYCYVVDRGYFPESELQIYLYDLQADPYQKSPLVLTKPIGHPIAASLDQALRSYLRQTEDPFDIDGCLI